MMFPVWFLKLIVIGGIGLCIVGALGLLTFLIFDMKGKRIW